MKILVTGGSRGLGSAICERLGAAGHEIVFFSKNSVEVENFSKVLKSKNVRAFGYTFDVLKIEQMENFWVKLTSDGHNFDVVINNVGGGGRWGSESPHLTPLSTWVEVLNKNLLAAEFFTLKSIPWMLENKFGRVICITSTYAHSIVGRPWFHIAKISENSLMRSLARHSEYSSNGITFNSVAPGAIQIPNTGWAKMLEESPKEYAAYINSLPARRIGKPEDVANLVLFLISEQASYINGAAIRVDGGESTLLDY